jgi:hypothetical protein
MTRDVVMVGVVGLILYLLYKGEQAVDPFDPWTPIENVTSTITYQGESAA